MEELVLEGVAVPPRPKGSLFQYKQALLARILERRNAFADTAAKRFRVILARSITQSGSTLRQDVLDASTEAFRQDAAQLLNEGYVVEIVGHIREIVAEAAQDPEMDFCPGTTAQCIALRFIQTLGQRFTIHAGQAMLAMQGDRPDTLKDLDAARAIFHGDMDPRVHRLNVDMVELYVLMHQSKNARRAANADKGALAEPEVVSQLLDAFGRGILHPVERYHGIADCELVGKGKFPRLLCGPTLVALRWFLVGQEKYDVINRKLLKSIYLHCNRQENFQREDLRLHFEQPPIRAFILSHLIYMLDLLRDETKADSFWRIIEKNLQERLRDDTVKLPMTYAIMLQHAWARHCVEHLSQLRGRAAARRILRKHLPDALLPMLEACPDDGTPEDEEGICPMMDIPEPEAGGDHLWLRDSAPEAMTSG